MLDPSLSPTSVSVSARIAQRVRELRAAAQLSLDELALRCGVSRSMISLIERGESSPTAVVLERLAVGLHVSLVSLFEAPVTAPGPVSRVADQLVWRDPASGYVRRNVSPEGVGSATSATRIVDVWFPSGAQVTYETGARQPPVNQQIWVLQGKISVTVGADTHHLEAGDCLGHRLDQPISYFNPGGEPARYAVVLTTDLEAGR